MPPTSAQSSPTRVGNRGFTLSAKSKIAYRRGRCQLASPHLIQEQHRIMIMIRSFSHCLRQWERQLGLDGQTVVALSTNGRSGTRRVLATLGYEVTEAFLHYSREPTPAPAHFSKREEEVQGSAGLGFPFATTVSLGLNTEHLLPGWLVLIWLPNSI